MTPDELLELRVRDATGTYHHRIGLAELEHGTLVTRQVTPEKLLSVSRSSSRRPG